MLSLQQSTPAAANTLGAGLPTLGAGLLTPPPSPASVPGVALAMNLVGAPNPDASVNKPRTSCRAPATTSSATTRVSGTPISPMIYASESPTRAFTPASTWSITETSSNWSTTSSSLLGPIRAVSGSASRAPTASAWTTRGTWLSRPRRETCWNTHRWSTRRWAARARRSLGSSCC